MPEKGNESRNIRDIFDDLPLGIILFDGEYKITDANENVFEFGVLNFDEKEELLGRVFSEEIFLSFETSQSFDENNLPFETNLKSLATAQGVYNITLKVAPFYREDKFEGGIAIIEDHIFKDYSIEKERPEVLLANIKPFHDAVFLLAPNGAVTASVFSGNKIKALSDNPKNVSDIFKDKKAGGRLSEIFSLFKDEPSVSDYLHAGDYLLKINFVKKNNGSGIIALVIDDVSNLASDYTIEEIQELEKFQFLSESIIDSVFGMDAKGYINLWNAGAEKIFGFNRSEVFGKFIGKVLPGIDSEYLRNLKEMLDTKGVWESELRINLGGEEKFVNVKLAKVEIDKEESILGIASDITKRIKIEKELRSSEERYRNIVTSSIESILLVNLEGRITYFNPSFIKITGFAENEIIGEEFNVFVDEDFLKQDREKVTQLFGKTSSTLEFPLVRKNGKPLYVFATATPFLDLNGEVRYYSVIMTDITEKKEAEKDLLLIRSVFEASMDGIAVIQNKKIVLANDSFAEVFGYGSIKKIMGTDPLDLCDEQDIVVLGDTIQKLEKGEEKNAQLEFRGKRNDSQELILNASITAYQSRSEKFIVLILRDVTRSKKAEQLIKESEERYRNITNAINDFLWMAERKNGVLKAVFYSASVEKTTGYKVEEFMNRKFLWFRIVHPQDRAGVIKQLKAIYKDDLNLDAELEYRIVNKIGNILWVRNKINIKRDESGEIKSLVGLVSDITLSKRAEEELRRSAEELSNLNESKDKFISIISHDLRSPFSSILGYTDMLLNNRDLPEEKEVEYISYIQSSAKNMLDLVNSLLDWTRLQTGRIKFEPKKIDANLLANKCINMLGGTALQKNINLVSDMDRQIFIHADEGLMMQAINNLVSNAIKFTNPGGSITISAEPIPEEHVVRFCVKDTGVGIEKKDINKLFRVDSKYTSPGTAGEKGTGLGLSLVKEIVEKHGGSIWVKSKKGSGTEFFFTIPVSSSTILLVDDLLTDRILYSKLIKSILPEYILKDAPNGKAAVEAVKNIAPLLVITEHKMPLMNGSDFIKQVQLSDDIPIKPVFVVLSRKLTKSAKKSYKDLGVEYVFQKPVELDKFRMAIISSLNRSITS